VSDGIHALIEQAEEWRAYHKARGVPGNIEALAASIRIKALKDALRAALAKEAGQ
jgi:hypothetical protein